MSTSEFIKSWWSPNLEDIVGIYGDIGINIDTTKNDREKCKSMLMAEGRSENKPPN